MRAARFVSLALTAALAAALLATPPGNVRAQAPLPIFDTHMHYSAAAWEPLPPGAVAKLLEAAGVKWALVSSSPDDGTLKLHEYDRARFMPVLRPYRGAVGAGQWARNAATPAYLAGRLKKGIYKGIGEFHLWDVADARTPVLREVIGLALQHDILLHVHAGAAPVRALFAQAPGLRILWAHAGMIAPPGEVGRMLDTHANLWAELSFRGDEILNGDGLDPAWRRLLLAHSDRFMIGSDTYVNSRWEAYGALIATHRRWLALLPPQIAKAIAHRNAARVLGVRAAQ